MNNKSELNELSKELVGLDNVGLEELEARLELALGHIFVAQDGPGCSCSALVTCVGFCFTS